MSKKEERQIEEKVFKQTARDEIEKIINPKEEKEAPIILTAKERQKAEIARQEEIARRRNAKKIAEKRQMEEEYMGAVASKRNAKARKIAHHRHLKNFGWWVTGFFSFILVIIIALGIIFAVIPLKTYFGDNSSDYVNDDIAESTPLQIVQNIMTYKAGDVPAIELLFNTILEDYELNKYISVDIDSINKATLVSSEFTDALSSSIKIIATLRSLGVADSMGDFGNTSAFQQFEKIEEKNLPDFSSGDFNEKLYYYQLDDGSYARAFDDDGVRVADSVGKDLYLPALVDVMLLELPEVLGDRLETMKFKDLLACFGMGDENTFTKIVEDRTIGEMKDFDINTVKISVVLPVESVTLRDSLIDMTYQLVIDNLAMEKYLTDNEGKTEEDWDALSEEDKQLIKDSVISTYPSGKEEQFELITVGDLANADMNKIRLASVMPETEQNKMMFDILVDMSGKDRDALTVGDMATADVTQIKISSVMPETEDNKKLFNVLEDMTRNNVLDSFACEKYLLDNPTLTEDDWKSLKEEDEATYLTYLYQAKSEYESMTTAEKHDLIRVVHMGNGDVTRIRLISILDHEGNEKLYSVLQDLASKNIIERYIFDNYEGITSESWQGKPDDYIMANGRTKGELCQEASARYYGLTEYLNMNYTGAEKDSKREELILNYINYRDGSSITDYSMLTSAQISDAENFFNGFDDDEKNDLITIASLDGGDITYIKLKSVITTKPTNKILAKLWEDDTATVGNMTDKLDALPVGQVYEKEVFTTDDSKKADEAKYKMTADTVTGASIYTLDGSGEYYISKEASIWLVMLYDCEGVDSTNGYGTKYTENLKTFSEMEASIGDISGSIKGASIRQLIEMGIIDDGIAFSGKYDKTLSEFISGS